MIIPPDKHVFETYVSNGWIVKPGGGFDGSEEAH
jgi:hypothetical protein